MGYEISICQMQYDANNKETDQKAPLFIHSGGNSPGKCWKHQLSWGHYRKSFAMEHMSAIFALRLIGPLASRDLYPCPQEVKAAAYKGLVCPVLEYSSSVWDPSGMGLQNELEKVQNRAARFVIGNYNFETGSMTRILEHLKWEYLKKWRRDIRLILLYKGLKGTASIPTDDLIPLVRRCRNHHSMANRVPIANTDI